MSRGPKSSHNIRFTSPTGESDGEQVVRREKPNHHCFREHKPWAHISCQFCGVKTTQAPYGHRHDVTEAGLREEHTQALGGSACLGRPGPGPAPGTPPRSRPVPAPRPQLCLPGCGGQLVVQPAPGRSSGVLGVATLPGHHELTPLHVCGPLGELGDTNYRA